MPPLTAAQLDCLPTERDIQFYEEHGWYVAPAVLPDAILDIAQKGADRLYQGERDRELPVRDGYSDWRPEDGDGVRNNEFVSLQIDEISQLTCYPMIGAIAARLTRSDTIRLLDDQLVYKPAGSESTGWHADHAYWGTCSSNKLLTAWIPFHDVDESQAPLIVLDESHQWSGLEHTRFFNDPDLDRLEATMAESGRAIRRVPFCMKRGQLSFHNCWTLHASNPNLSNAPRLALALHLQDGDNHYRQAFAPDGREVHIFDETLCRKLPNGDPDFTDPAIFPELWPGMQSDS